MRWYNPRRWFNLNTGIVLIGIIVFLVFAGTIVVGISLWNVPLAKELFPVLEISEVFPTKAIALFSGLASFGTLFLALTTMITLKRNREENELLRKDNRDKEDRDRKERKLNRIIDWATQILECNRDLAFVQAGFRTSEIVSITGYKANFNILSWRGVHIGFIAKSITKDVSDAVEDERNLLRQHKRIMDLEEEGKLRKETAVGTHRKRIDESARTIIELAVKLL